MKKMISRILQRATLKDQQNKQFTKVLDLATLNLGNSCVIFDVGAYHGSFTDEFQRISPASQFHLFEPNLKAFEKLEKKFSQRQGIVLNHVAISNKTEKSVLYLNTFDETNSLLPSNSVDPLIDPLTRNIGLQDVNVIRLDNYIHTKNIKLIDFVKIDTQGNSYNVLDGLGSLLSSQKVKFLYLEAEFIQIYKNEKCFSEIEIFMRQNGYRLKDIFNVNYTKDGMLAWCDALFCL